MAMLALAAGGAALGSYIGIGASVGWMVGSVVATMIFPTEGEDTSTEGPRLGDLSVASSAFGAPVARAYGTMRTAGNMIWSSGIQETKHVQEQDAGGKGMPSFLGGGGSSATATSYTYSASFALAFAEGEAEDVIRIWADSKLIYDKTASTSAHVSKEGLVFRFYSGSETQTPDSLIEDDVGDGSAPAHRGLCYIVFEDLQLQDFGNRIPNITAEITFKKSTVKPIVISNVPTWQQDSLTISVTRNRGYISTSSHDIHAFDLNTMNIVQSRAFGDFISALHVGENTGFVYFSEGSSNSQPIVKCDPSSISEVDRFGTDGLAVSNSETRFAAAIQLWEFTVLTLGNQRNFLAQASHFDSIGLLDADTMEYLWHDNDPSGAECKGITGPRVPGFEQNHCYFGIGGTSSASANAYIVKLKATMLAYYVPASPPDPGYTFGVSNETFTVTSTDLGASGDFELEALAYDDSDGTVILFVTYDGAVGPGGADNGIAKWSEADGIIWSIGDDGLSVLSNSGINQSVLNSGRLGHISAAGDVTMIDTRTGEIIYQEDWIAEPFRTGGFMWYDSPSDTLIGSVPGSGITRAYLGRGGGQGATVSSIVSDLCSRAGLTLSDVDVTELTDEVPGYLIGRQSTVRASIEPLAAAFFFDGVETDWKVVFKGRGRASTRTINAADLAPTGGDQGEIIQENRTQEVELPERFSVAYLDRSRNYQQNTASSKRVVSPKPSMYSSNKLNLPLPIALEATKAKEISEVSLYTAWRERMSYNVHLDWTHLDLDPADVIQIQLDSALLKARIVKMDVGVGFDIEVDSLSEDQANYSSTTSANSGLNFPVSVPKGSGYTQLFVLDLPLLRSYDDTGGVASNTYYAASGYGQAGWPGAYLFKGSDGINYSSEATIYTEAPWGYAISVPGTPIDPFTTDEVNTIKVSMVSGDTHLASVTQLEMVNGANVGVLINSSNEPEIVQFRDVTQNADGTYTLSGLLRGRKGTDYYIDEHSNGDRFLLLQDSSGHSWMNKALLSISELNVVRYWKGVGFGTLIENAPAEPRTSIGRDMMPYSVVHVAWAQNSGDTDVTWVRRTRLDGSLRDLVGAVPLGETSEEYEIDVRAVGSGSVTGAVTGLTSEAWTYTAAQKAIDWGTPPAQVEIDIYQISSVVGRGFKRTETIDI